LVIVVVADQAVVVVLSLVMEGWREVSFDLETVEVPAIKSLWSPTCKLDEISKGSLAKPTQLPLGSTSNRQPKHARQGGENRGRGREMEFLL
jgi:hypothetical protein